MPANLTQIWKNLKIRAAASDLFPLPLAVREEMERAGWTFHTQTVISSTPYAGSGSVVVMMEIKSPDGRSAHGGEPGAYETYRTARRSAALKVYGPL